ILAVSGAVSYTWTVSSGGTITSGQGTTGINVSFGPNFPVTYTICVWAVNLCGPSPQVCMTTAVTCAPGVVYDVEDTASWNSGSGGGTTWTMTTHHANDIIIMACNGWPSALSNAAGVVTVNGNNATYIGGEFGSNSSESSVWAFLAA